MCKRQICLSCFGFVLVLMAAGVRGGLTDPPLVNPSFEDPALDPGTQSTDINGWWDAVSYTYTMDGAAAGYPEAHGDNWSELGNGRWIYQQIGTYEHNMDIEISFLLGQKNGNNSVGLTVELFAGGNAQLAADVDVKRDAAGFPLTSVVGAVLIAASEQLNPFIAGGVTEAFEMSIRLSTGTGGTGYAVGDPLWLVFSRPSVNGRTLIDNVVVTALARNIATSPQPTDGVIDVLRETALNWSPGEFATTHDVYFGTIFDDVSNASRTDPRGALVSQGQPAATYDPPGRLDLDQTYYWRIDEVNAPPTSTIFKGDVWSFTVEPLAYPIDAQSITPTASSFNSGAEGPENTVNGSGLDDDDLHSAESGDMWLSNMTGAQPTWIQYEFDKVYKLHQMVVWNYNTTVEPAIGFGVKEATIEYSADGANWTALGTTHEFAQGHGSAGYAANTTIDLGGAAAKYVRITANSNWGGLLPQFGLSEVRFFSIPVLAREPSPAYGATDVGVDATLSWRAGREAARHNVYLSTDEQAVIDGTAPVVTVTSPSYASSLDLAGTYYWRIDEVNDVETPT
ncbi:MAG TPA: discoidin domain-containing protein, partial [Sedimentisphaerales bacterium]|nr:discoidin domain-containing protein [Sedimentisphaerales bacterium]